MSSTQPSTPSVPLAGAHVNRWAFGCMFVFFIPFFLIGAFVFVAAFSRADRDGQFFTTLAFGGLFMGVGIVMMTVARVAMRRYAQMAARRAAHPDAPWMWREDWAQRTARDRAEMQGYGLLIFGLIWTLLSSMVILPVREQVAEGKQIALLGLIFPLVGLIVLMAAGYQFLKRRKYGAMVIQLDNVPIEPGRSFRVTVPVRLHEVPQPGIAATLTLINRVVTGTGKNSSIREVVKWAEEKTIQPGSASPSANGIMIPVSFTIPHDAHPTEETFPSNTWAWRLRLSAEVPGVDYAAEYELPVFRGPGWREREDQVEEARHEFEARIDPSGWTPKPASGITLSHSPSGGELIHIRRGSFSWGGVVFLLIWGGVVYALIHFSAPIMFAIVFGLIWLLGLVGVLDAALGWGEIEVERSQLVIRRSLAGITSRKAYSRDQIETILAMVTATAAANSPVKYDVKVVKVDGTKDTIASMLADKGDADMLAARLRKVMAISSSRTSAAD